MNSTLSQIGLTKEQVKAMTRGKLAAPAAGTDACRYMKQLEAQGCAPARTPSFLVDVNPALARAWLANNEGNRKPSQAKIRRYAAMMADGAWDENGESVKFSADGRLLDGQSRLQAILLSGVEAQRLEVRFGLPARTQETMDSGELRSIGHTLQMRGEGDYYARASALRMLHLYINGRLFPSTLHKNTTNSGTLYFGNRQALALLDQHPGIRASVTAAYKLKQWMPPSRLGTLFYIFRQANKALAEVFESSLISGAALESGSPVLALRQRFMMAAAGDEIPIQAKIVFVIKAWNAAAAGKQVNVLTWRRGDPFPAVTGCKLQAKA